MTTSRRSIGAFSSAPSPTSPSGSRQAIGAPCVGPSGSFRRRSHGVLPTESLALRAHRFVFNWYDGDPTEAKHLADFDEIVGSARILR